jgi:hypothetical protein
MKNIFKVTSILVIILMLTNCKKDKVAEPEPVPTPTSPTSTAGALSILFEGMVGDSALTLSTSTYTNAVGNTFNVTLYKYYISNIN